MPDIDTDYSNRDAVVEYIKQKYGTDKVAFMRTFGLMGAKSALKRAAQALKIPFDVSNAITGCMPDGDDLLDWQINGNIEKGVLPNSHLQKYQKEYPDLFKLATAFEGLIENFSTHPAGVIIAPERIDNFTAIALQKEDYVTEYHYKYLENLGLMKVDILGVSMLSKFQKVLELIKERHNNDISLEKIPVDDPLIYKAFSDGDTITTFQFESEGMRQLCKKVKPSNMEDLSALNALFRPGPNRFIDDFDNNKKSDNISYPHPKLIPVLKNTYGIMVYQEQSMQTVSILGGLSLSKADTLRKAIGKKNVNLMEQVLAEFIEGGLKNGVEIQTLEQLADWMRTFAGYGFNKSHSLAYAFIAYYSMWFKVYYPVEWYSACFDVEMGKMDTVALYIQDARQHGIRVLPPDINNSKANCSVYNNDTILIGLKLIKHLGEPSLVEILEKRPFVGIGDLLDRCSTKVNKRVVKALIYAGAFDSINPNRSWLLAYLYNFKETKKKLKKEIADLEPINYDRLAAEKEVLGLYLSNDPLQPFMAELTANNTLNHKQYTTLNVVGKSSTVIVIGGMITKVPKKVMKDKFGRAWGYVEVQTYDNGVINVTFFGDAWAKTYEKIEEGKVIRVKGVKQKDGRMIGYAVQRLDEFAVY